MNSIYVTEEIQNRAKEIKEFTVGGTFSAGIPVTDRNFWDKMHEKLDKNDIIARAERYINEPFPTINEEIYMDSNSRTKADKILFTSMRRLEQTVLAECVENKGRFMDYINSGIKSVCERKSWVRPGHDSIFSYSDYKGVHGQIDLYSSSVAWRMSVIDCCLGERLTDETRAMIKNKVREKVLDVFFRRLYENPEEIKINNVVPMYWLDAFDNWLSVCLGCVVGAGIYYCNDDERALLIAVYEKMIQNYLNSLPGGYCVEGLSYWGYGFGKFIAAADIIYRATNGRVDIYAQKEFLEAARFGMRIGITENTYPTVADCDIYTTPLPFCMKYLSKRTGLSYDYRYEDPGVDIYIVMMMANWDNRLTNSISDEEKDDILRTYFKNQGILVARNEQRSMGIYIQAGTNHVPHGHNDIGNFIIAAEGETFVSDPGTSQYNSVTFSKDRYTLEVLSSFGHSVPRVGGQLQGPAVFGAVNTNYDGKRSNSSYDEVKFIGTIIKESFSDDRDSIVIDMKKAYDCPNLIKLEREMVFDRIREEITVKDSFEFKEEDNFETAFITFYESDIISCDKVIINGKNNNLTVNYSGESGNINIACVKDAFACDKEIAVHPIRIAKKVKAQKGSVSMKFVLSRK